MADLPDELWQKILETGVQTNNNGLSLSFKDICCIAITCKRLHRISNEPILWSSLLSSDFPHNNNASSSSSLPLSPRSLYKSRYEKEKARRVAAHRRGVLRVESEIAVISRRLAELRRRRAEESDRIKAVTSELSNLVKVRRASVALNVWQPELVRGRQKQIVEQCAVPVNSRINALEMELKLCKQHVRVHEKNYIEEKQRLEEAKERLNSMRYHPLHEIQVIERRVGDPSIKRKKMKIHISDDEQS